jgi:hypothetical protein
MCREAERLFAAYSRAMLVASTAAKKLANLAGSTRADNFIFLCNEKTRANARVKKTQAAYEKHIGNHGCGISVGSGTPKL